MLLLLLLFALSYAHLPRVRFHVQNYEYIQMCAGEPCTWITLKLNRTSNDFWLHNKNYISTSQTYQHTHGDALESELFYFNTVRLRLHLRVRPPTELAITSPIVPFDGTLGLGPKSELWAFWDNYTLSQTRLELGGYMNYAQRRPHEYPPIIDLDDAHQVTLGDGSLANIRFNLTTTETLIPYSADLSTALSKIKIHTPNCRPYYEYLGIEGGPECKNTAVLSSDGLQSLKLTNGIHYQAVAYTDGNDLIVGTHLIDEFVVFYGVSCNCLILAEDAFSLDYPTLMAICSLLLFIMLALWLVIAESPADRENEWEFRLMIAAEMYSYLMDVLLYYLAFGMLDWGRYASQYAECSSAYVLVYLAVMFFLSLGTLCYTAYPWRGYSAYLVRFRDNGIFHAAVFSLAQAGFIWLVFVEEHETTFNRILIAVVESAVLIFTMVALGELYLKRKMLHFSVLSVATGMTYAFLIYYSLLPMFEYANMHSSPWESVFDWIYFFIWMPSLLLLTTYRMVKQWTRIKKLK